MNFVDSTNTQPPDFGPGWPLYPELPQLNRVTGPAVGGTSPPIYPAITQQYTGSLNFRDRELSYVIEPNSIALGPGIYDTRLVGRYAGLPLYATTCCTVGSFSSSSSSQSSQASGPASLPSILRTSLGSSQAQSVASIIVPNVSVVSGGLLIVLGSVLGSSESARAAFGPYTMLTDGSKALPVGAALAGGVFCFSLAVPGGLTGDVEFEVTGGIAAALTVQLIQVANLASLASDKVASASGSLSTPDAGSTGVLTSATEYAQAVFALLTPGGAHTWAGGFSSGGQDVNETILTVAARITEGYKITSSTAALDASLSGVTPAAWAGLCVTYR